MPLTQRISMLNNTVDAATQAAHMIASLESIAHIIQVISILLGLSLFTHALLQLRRFAESRTYMSHQMTLWGPMSTMLAGVLLLILPYTVTTSLRAFFGPGQTLPLTYQHVHESGLDTYMPVVLTFVRLIGVGAMVRACMLLSRAGKSNSQSGLIGKALIHLFGGILCVHILGTVQLIKAIFDVS